MQLNLLDIDNDVEESKDYVPNRDFTLDTGMYPMVVDMAYLSESQAGAMNVVARFKEIGGKREHQETFYITSNKQNGQRNYYKDAQGAKRLMPGMDAANQLSIITSGQPLGQTAKEEKLVGVYNFEAKKELPTKVTVLTDVIGQKVLVAITKCRANKRAQVNGKWTTTAKERVFNEASKFLYTDGHSVAEMKAGEPEKLCHDRWVKSFDATYVKDTYKEVAPDAGVEAASAEAAAATTAAVDDLLA